MPNSSILRCPARGQGSEGDVTLGDILQSALTWYPGYRSMLQRIGHRDVGGESVFYGHIMNYSIRLEESARLTYQYILKKTFFGYTHYRTIRVFNPTAFGTPP